MGRSSVTNCPGTKSNRSNSATSIQKRFVLCVWSSIFITFPLRQGWTAICNQFQGKIQKRMLIIQITGRPDNGEIIVFHKKTAWHSSWFFREQQSSAVWWESDFCISFLIYKIYIVMKKRMLTVGILGASVATLFSFANMQASITGKVTPAWKSATKPR